MNFLQNAYNGKTEWWRYLLVFFFLFLATQIGSFPLVLVALMTLGYDMQQFDLAAKNNFAGIGMDSNLHLFLMLIPFMVLIFILYVSVKYLHKMPFKDLVTTRRTIDFKRVVFAFLVWAGFSILMILVGLFWSPEDYVWNFKPIPFFILLLISFLFLPFQTSAEEWVFRGYLMQALGVLSKNRWFPLLLTSLLFGLLHGMNPEVQKLGSIAMVYYIGTGLLLGAVTLMDEGTELAMGFHAANNIVAAFFVTTDWMVFQTEALFVDVSEPSVAWQLFFPVLILYPCMLFLFAKKYRWTDWKQKLTGSFKEPKQKTVHDPM